MGGIYDDEFELYTRILFDRVFKKGIRLIISELLEGELTNAPEQVRTFFKSLPVEQMEFVKLTKEGIELAELYVKEKVVGETSRADCRHIARATLIKADVLVSWNF